MIRRLSIFACAVAAGACEAAPSNQTFAAPDQAAANAAAAPAGSASEAPSRPPAQGIRSVTLEGEGLRLVNPGSGSATPLPFGTPKAQTVAALAVSFGTPPAEQSTNAECGAGPVLHVRWESGFVALFQEDRFLGWQTSEAGLTTADGIGIGSTRAELEASREVSVEQSTLGTEFSAGGLGGLLDSAEPGARIAALWAGLTCHFR